MSVHGQADEAVPIRGHLQGLRGVGGTTDLGGKAGEGGGEAAAMAGRDHAPPDSGGGGVVERCKRGPLDSVAQYSVAQRCKYGFSFDPAMPAPPCRCRRHRRGRQRVNFLVASRNTGQHCLSHRSTTVAGQSKDRRWRDVQAHL